MSLPRATLQLMESAILLGFAVLALLILGATLFAASIPLLWYLAAAALFFSGLIGPALWIHGHVHDSFDYPIGRTTVVCNPRGYLGYGENPRFDSARHTKVLAA